MCLKINWRMLPSLNIGEFEWLMTGLIAKIRSISLFD